MTRAHLFRTILAGLISLAPPARGAPPLPTDGDVQGERVQPLSGWPKYCGSLSLSGQPMGRSVLGPETASLLDLAWKVPLGGPVASAPSIWGSTLYVGDWSGKEWAIGARTGAVLASVDLGTTRAPQCNPSVIGVTSSPAVADGRIYLAGGDDAFYALDAATLAVLWRTRLGDNSADGGYYGWSSPAVVGNRVIQGVASACDAPYVAGRLVMLDAGSGAIVAEAPFVPKGAVGNGVWTSPAVDLDRREVFVTTANGPDPGTGLFGAIVRLSLESLAVLESWRYDLGGVVWDADWGSSPTLFVDGNGTPLVGAGHKDGNYYAFDRRSVSNGPVWTARIANQGAVPQSGEGTLSTASFDGARLYVGGGAPPGPADPAVGGTVVAVDPTTGAVLWRQAFPGPVIAPVSTVNGVVFAAGGNLVAAIDAGSGRVLWSFRTPIPCYGGIAISSGRIYFGDLTGTLYCFGIS